MTDLKRERELRERAAAKYRDEQLRQMGFHEDIRESIPFWTDGRTAAFAQDEIASLQNDQEREQAVVFHLGIIYLIPCAYL